MHNRRLRFALLTVMHISSLRDYEKLNHYENRNGTLKRTDLKRNEV
jgi:hypothetical protein